VAIYSGFPANGGKDWDDVSSTNPKLRIFSTVATSGIETSSAWAYVILDTSATSGKIITAATITFWNVNNVWFTPASNNIYLWDGSGYNVHAYSRAGAVASNRYVTTALTTTAQLACINASGGVETSLRFNIYPIPNPAGAELTSEWNINAYESGSTVCTRVGVRYNEPAAASSRRRPFIIC